MSTDFGPVFQKKFHAKVSVGNIEHFHVQVITFYYNALLDFL